MDAVIFSEVEKSAIVLSVLGELGVWLGMYFYSRQKLPREQNENDVMLYIYAGISSLLLGQTLAHVLPNALLGGLIEIKMLTFGFGILVLMAFYKLYFMLTPSAYKRNLTPLLEPSATIDNDSQEEREYYDVSGAAGFNEQTKDALHQRIILRLHRLTVYILYGLFLCSLILEGFILPYNPRQVSSAKLVIAFWFLRILQSACMAGFCIYARLHRTSDQGKIKKGYLIMMILWMISSTASCIPMLMELDAATIQSFVEHGATGSFYSFFGGIILCLSMQLMFVFPREFDRLEAFISILISTILFVAMWLLGYWL